MITMGELDDILRNLLNIGVHGTAASIFSNTVINTWNQLDQRAVGASRRGFFNLRGLIRQALGLSGGFSGW